MVDTPLSDDHTTTRPGPGLCPVCWATFQPTGRQRFCSDACRKTAWDRTHRTVPHPVEPIPPAGRRRDATIYSCPGCDTRYYAQQWCPDCNQPCTRVGFGGLCPHCDEPVALTDLLDTAPARTAPIQLSRG